MFVAELPTSFDHLSSRLFMSSRFFPMPVISHCWCLHVEIVPAANKSCRVAATKNLYLSSFITNVFDQNSRLHLSDILFVQLYKKKLIHHRLYARIKPCFVKVLHRSKATYDECQAWEHIERMRNAKERSVFRISSMASLSNFKLHL